MGLFSSKKKKPLPPPPAKDSHNGLFEQSPVDMPPKQESVQQNIGLNTQPTPPTDIPVQNLEPAPLKPGEVPGQPPAPGQAQQKNTAPKPQNPRPAQQNYQQPGGPMQQPASIPSNQQAMPQQSPQTLPGITPQQPAQIQQPESAQTNVPDNLPKLNIPDFSSDMANAPLSEIPYFSDVEVSRNKIDILPVIDTEKAEFTNFRYDRSDKPLYVRTDYYSQIITNLERIKTNVIEGSEIVYGLENLKRNADAEHLHYKKVLDDIQRKLIYVDKIIFEGGKS